MCEHTERDNQHDDSDRSNHPAIRRALAFLLEEAYRYGDTKGILILSDTIHRFDIMENDLEEDIDAISGRDINHLILFLKKYLSLDRKTREGLINQLIERH